MARSRDISKVFSSDTAIVLEEELERPFRNLIINGAMQVAQRGTSVTSITGNGYNTTDRWNLIASNTGSLGTWTQSVETDAPTGSGFRKSLKMLCTTADASPAVDDQLYIRQIIEGQNLQAIKKGTANAEQLTVSFWVKSNVTGTYIVELRDADNNRSVSTSYSIASSGTWEKKTLVFPADTTGAFDNNNARSLDVNWWLGAGTDSTSGTLQTTWGSLTVANRAVGQTNLAAATNNYWQVTGVQLEVGAVATPFEFKPIEQELAECKRYFQELPIHYGEATSANTKRTLFLFSEMRAAPTATLTAQVFDGSWKNPTSSSVQVGKRGGYISVTLSTNYAYVGHSSSQIDGIFESGKLRLDIEL